MKKNKMYIQKIEKGFKKQELKLIDLRKPQTGKNYIDNRSLYECRTAEATKTKHPTHSIFVNKNNKIIIDNSMAFFINCL